MLRPTPICLLRNTRKTELPSAPVTRVFLARLVARTAPFALLRNTRKTDSLRHLEDRVFLPVWCRASAAFALLLALTTLMPAADDAAAVQASSNAWRQAVIKQDKNALEKLLADDLIYAHSNGRTESKSEYIAAVTKGASHYESFTDLGTKIRVYGTAAILEGNVEVKPAGRPAYRVRTLEVYVKNGSQWEMTAHQSARLNP